VSSTESIRLAHSLQSIGLLFDGPAAERGGEGVEVLLRTEYQRGYDEGAAHVNQQILEQRNEISEMRALLFENAEQAVQTAVGEVRGALPQLVIQAVSRLIRNFDWDAESVAQVAEDVLVEAGVDPREIELRLNPQDLELLRDLDPSMADRHPGVKLVGDGRLERGGCEAITRFGKIDGRISHKLDRLAASMGGSV
jgi:flagellar biosynthesis/type III secretory pathway protein FliH